MILCHQGYIQSASVFEHPITNERWSEWVGAVNATMRYCKTLALSNAMEFEGMCEAVDLPSAHPYWAIQVARDLAITNERHRANLEKIKADPWLLARLYNASTTLKMVEDSIAAREQEIKRILQQ